MYQQKRQYNILHHENEFMCSFQERAATYASIAGSRMSCIFR